MTISYKLITIIKNFVFCLGLCKCSPTSILMVNSGKNEIVEIDNSFNVIRRYSGRNLFSKNISDVACSGGYIYIADAGACQVVMMNKEGSVVKRFGRAGTGNQEFKRPNGICVDSKGRVIVSDSLNHRVKVRLHYSFHFNRLQVINNLRLRFNFEKL